MLPNEPLAPFSPAPSALRAATEAPRGDEFEALLTALAREVEAETLRSVRDELSAGLLAPVTDQTPPDPAAELDAGPRGWRAAVVLEAAHVVLCRFAFPSPRDHRALDAIRRANPTGVAEASLAALDQSGALDRLTSGKTCRANFG